MVIFYNLVFFCFLIFKIKRHVHKIITVIIRVEKRKFSNKKKVYTTDGRVTVEGWKSKRLDTYIYSIFICEICFEKCSKLKRHTTFSTMKYNLQ